MPGDRKLYYLTNKLKKMVYQLNQSALPIFVNEFRRLGLNFLNERISQVSFSTLK